MGHPAGEPPHNILCALGWITEQKIIVVPKKKGNVPYLGIRLDTLFKQPSAQVRAVGEIAENDRRLHSRRRHTEDRAW